MTSKAHCRGHEIYFDEGESIWRFSDTGESAMEVDRPCARCGQPATPEGHDACLGELPGVSNACCGHGVGIPYRMEDDASDE